MADKPKKGFRWFFRELKERKIFATLAAFIAGGWFIMEVVHWLLIDHYHFPEESLDITLVTLIGALCSILIFQWFRVSEQTVERIKMQIILISGVVLVSGLLDMMLLQQIIRHEESVIEESEHRDQSGFIPAESSPPIPEDKPSIAVLPFASIGNDPNNESLCDGLAEYIITALSKSIDLAVIARNSSFMYKGKSVNVRQVSKELGVQYVLEGSVSKAGERIRVTAQLIDAVKGHHLWAEQYDRTLGAIFELEEEIVKKIVVALQVELTEGEQARIFARGTDSFEAHLKVLQALALYRQNTTEANLRARQPAAEALVIDPNYAMAYCILAWTYMSGSWLGWSEPPDESLARAEELARKAIALDDSLFYAHGAFSMLLAITGRHDQAIVEAKRGVTLAPNSASAYAYYGYVLHVAGRNREAIPIYEKAFRLNPFPPLLYLNGLARNYLFEGMYKESIELCEKAIRLNPNNTIAHLQLAANYTLTGLDDKARNEIIEVMRIDPTFSLDNYEKSLIPSYKDKTGPSRYIEALRKVWPR